MQQTPGSSTTASSATHASSIFSGSSRFVCWCGRAAAFAAACAATPCCARRKAVISSPTYVPKFDDEAPASRAGLGSVCQRGCKTPQAWVRAPSRRCRCRNVPRCCQLLECVQRSTAFLWVVELARRDGAAWISDGRSCQVSRSAGGEHSTRIVDATARRSTQLPQYFSIGGSCRCSSSGGSTGSAATASRRNVISGDARRPLLMRQRAGAGTFGIACRSPGCRTCVLPPRRKTRGSMMPIACLNASPGEAQLCQCWGALRAMLQKLDACASVTH